MLSLSRAIEVNKKEYYNALQHAQRSNEITPWLNYFLQIILNAQKESEAQIEFTLKTTKFFDRFKDTLNERQMKVIRRMFQEGPQGFKGGMNTKKYIGLTHISKATATRDLLQLIAIQAFILRENAGGRSTSYLVNL